MRGENLRAAAGPKVVEREPRAIQLDPSPPQSRVDARVRDAASSPRGRGRDLPAPSVTPSTSCRRARRRAASTRTASSSTSGTSNSDPGSIAGSSCPAVSARISRVSRSRSSTAGFAAASLVAPASAAFSAAIVALASAGFSAALAAPASASTRPASSPASSARTLETVPSTNASSVRTAKRRGILLMSAASLPSRGARPPS